MYELLGVIAVIAIIALTVGSVRNIFFLVAVYNLSVAAVSWYNHNIDTWFSSLGISAMALTCVSLDELIHSKFLRDSYDAMPKETSCCIPHFGCSTPDSVLFLTCVIRALAGITASISFYITWSYRERFWYGQTHLVITMWVASASLWICSCVPHFICLLQCAATRESDKIIAFRKRVTIWLIHDVVLGIFWLYLAFMLDHLLKDDDSEWRTVFLSMMSWHIIIFVCRKLYLSDIWRTTKHVSCCAPETIGRWAVVLTLLSMGSVYGVLVHVVRDSVNMGCSIEQVIIVISSLSVGAIGYIMSSIPPRKKLKTDDTPILSKSGIYQLDF